MDNIINVRIFIKIDELTCASDKPDIDLKLHKHDWTSYLRYSKL